MNIDSALHQIRNSFGNTFSLEFYNAEGTVTRYEQCTYGVPNSRAIPDPKSGRGAWKPSENAEYTGGGSKFTDKGTIPITVHPEMKLVTPKWWSIKKINHQEIG